MMVPPSSSHGRRGSSIDISPLTTQISLGIARTTREPVPPPPPRPPQLHRRSSTPRHHARHEAQSADLFRSNLSPLQLLFVTMREYWRKSGHGAGHSSQVRPLPNICGSFAGFECMVLEIVGLSLPHAHHERCHHAFSSEPSGLLRRLCEYGR